MRWICKEANNDQPVAPLKETASQTAGPYVHIGLAPHAAGFDIFANNFSNVLAGPETEGERIIVEGRVIDGSGTPVRDALPEIWQAKPRADMTTWRTGRKKPWTRIFLDGDVPAPISKPGSSASRPEVRRKTLIAERSERNGQGVYRFDIRLQGEQETVFFDV